MPCYNRAHDLSMALQAYDCQLGSPSFEMIAIDDGSTDQTPQVLSAFKPANYTIRVHRQERNLGPASARNAGIYLSSAPLILFVGDDIIPDPFLVSGHIAHHRFFPQKEIAILGKVTWPEDMPVNTLMTHIDGIGAEQFSYYFLQHGQFYDYRHFYTANVSVKRALLETQPKWFDTDFPFAAFEDVELSYRLSQLGMKIVYASNLVGHHYHYHTIWTFSNRQYKAGEMACLVVKKQPATRKLLLGKLWRLRLLRLRLLARISRLGSMDATSDKTRDQLESAALHIASAFEWRPHPLLDDYYLGLLSYFFYKGMIFGSIPNRKEAQEVSDLLAQRALSRLIAKFSTQSN